MSRRFVGLILILLGIFMISSYFYTKYYLFVVTIKEDPVAYMKQLEQQGDWQRLQIYADFVRNMPFSDSTRQFAEEMYKKAEQEKNSIKYKAKECFKGLFGGEVNSWASAICDFVINLTPIGDIRDLLISDDEFTTVLSAIGLGLNVAPELKIFDSMLKVLWKAKALSEDMVKYILKLGEDAKNKTNISARKDFIKANWEYFSALKMYGFAPIKDTYIYAKDGKDIEKMVKLTKEYRAPEVYMAIVETEGKVLKTDKYITFFSPNFSLLNIIKSSLKVGISGGFKLLSSWLYNKLGILNVIIGFIVSVLGLRIVFGNLRRKNVQEVSSVKHKNIEKVFSVVGLIKKVFLVLSVALVLVVALALVLTGISNTQKETKEVKECANYLDAGDYQKAIELGKKAVNLYPKNADAYLCLGKAYHKTGQIDLAIDNLKKAEAHATKEDELMQIYSFLGSNYGRKGDLDNALFYNSKSLDLAKKLGNREYEVTALNNIALILNDKGELDKALEYLEESLRLSTDEKDKASIYNNIALIYKSKGEYNKAIEYCKKAIAIFERYGDYHESGKVMLNLGDAYIKIKDYDNAYSFLSEGLKRVQKVGDKYWEGGGLTYFGLYFIDKEDIKSAMEYLNRAYETFKSIGAQKYALELSKILSMLEKLSKILSKVEELSKSLSELKESGKEPKPEELSKIRSGLEELSKSLAEFEEFLKSLSEIKEKEKEPMLKELSKSRSDLEELSKILSMLEGLYELEELSKSRSMLKEKEK